MCIAIVQVEGSVIDKKRLKNCFDSNPDGCGMAWIDDGKIQMFHHMEFEPFYDEYQTQVALHMDSKFLIHFRIGTQGEIAEFNCHPFQVDETTAFIHNGRIPNMPVCKTFSDTWYFNEDVIKGLPQGWMYNASIQFLIDQSIGYSKVAILDATNNHAIIIGEDKGVWESDGNWYSNKTYADKEVPKLLPYQKTRYGYGHGWWGDYDDDFPKSSNPERREWTVGTQRRCYIDGKLHGYDSEHFFWREITCLGDFKNTLEEDERSYDIKWNKKADEKLEKCEMCPEMDPRDSMFLARFDSDDPDEVFWVCQQCKEDMQMWIDSGVMKIIGEEEEITELEEEVATVH